MDDSRIVISDTSCLIALERIGQIDLLRRLFRYIETTDTVETEYRAYGDRLPAWIEIRSIVNRDKAKDLRCSLDPGEASAITLALETENAYLLIDEEKGRKIAAQHGIRLTGTVGILLHAKTAGLLNAIKPSLERLLEFDFRMSDRLIEQILREAGE